MASAVIDLESDEGRPFPKRPRNIGPSEVIDLLSDDDDDALTAPPRWSDPGWADAEQCTKAERRKQRQAQRRAEPAARTTVSSDRADSVAAVVPRAQPTDADPAWLKLRGVKRVMGEFRAMHELVSRKEVPITSVQLVGDDAMIWQITISQFDSALPGGRALNADLAELQRKHGMGHVLMELRFPRDYPASPFALRVVLPRMRWYTGHVTAGGSVCMEMLTNSGTDNSWRSSFTVEGVLLVALTNMIDCESTIVRTATGPGGRSGPLRVDLRGEYGHSPMTPYSEMEASAAFSRMLDHHKRNGW